MKTAKEAKELYLIRRQKEIEWQWESLEKGINKTVDLGQKDYFIFRDDVFKENIKKLKSLGYIVVIDEEDDTTIYWGKPWWFSCLKLNFSYCLLVLLCILLALESIFKLL